jgi:hypothetical protein
MSARARQAAGAAQRGDGAGRDAGMDARGRATQARVGMPAVEQRREQLPRAVADEDAARAAKARRNAWLLAGLALFFYVGYIAWMFVRANGG